jgi:WD40 repeat protein
VTLWNVADRGAPRSLATIGFGDDVPPFGELAFSPDGATLVTGTVHGHLTLWNITDPANPTISSTMDDVPIGEHVIGATVGIALAFSPDGHTLTSITGSIKSTRWDVTDRTRSRYLNERNRTDAGPGNFLLTPDARAVVGAAHGAVTINVWTLD